jgi:hypothetical protein
MLNPKGWSRDATTTADEAGIAELFIKPDPAKPRFGVHRPLLQFFGPGYGSDRRRRRAAHSSTDGLPLPIEGLKVLASCLEVGDASEDPDLINFVRVLCRLARANEGYEDGDQTKTDFAAGRLARWNRWQSFR